MRHRPDGVLAGPARVDARTKNLVRRLRAGEIAVIDHEDLDRVSAEGLAERAPAAVINASRSISGRYPNSGPVVLAEAGIPLFDLCDEGLLGRVREGDSIRIRGTEVFVGGELLGTAVRLQGEELERRIAAAHAAVPEELERFVVNTMSYLQREGDLILRGEGIPETRTSFAGRHALVVVRGYSYKEDLATLRGYIADFKPVLVAVDGAADAMLAEGFRPDIIIGDMDSVSSRALQCGAELIVHAYADGRAPGLERTGKLGLEATLFPAGGTSEDIALLLAYERGADLIVAVGSHATLAEFLDKGRGGMASTFLVRLKVGPKLVDAKGVHRLYRRQVSLGLLVLLVGSALAAMLVAIYLSSALRLFLDNLLEFAREGFYRLRHVF